MGLMDIMAQPEPSREVVAVGNHVPSHSRESSTSSTASAASICYNGGLSQTAEEELTSSALSSPMPIYSPLSICSLPTAIIPNHSVIILLSQREIRHSQQFKGFPVKNEVEMNQFMLFLFFCRSNL